MKFASCYRLWESKFRKIPPSVIAEAERLSDLYQDSLNKITKTTIKQFKKIGLPDSWKDYFEDENVWFVIELSQATFFDLQKQSDATAKVYIAYGQGGNDYATYDSTNNILVIYDELCRGLSREKLVSTMAHELVHGIQEYKKFSEEYTTQLAKKTKSVAFYYAYYTQPMEFDAFTSEIGLTIQRKYKQLTDGIKEAKDPATKKLLELRISKFLLELKNFTESPLENYLTFKELPLPSVFETFEDLLQTIKGNDHLRRLLKLKLHRLHEELTTPPDDSIIPG